MNLNKYVLDSSAVLAVFKGEPGADQVKAIFERSVISSVNLSECVAKVILSSARNAPRDEALSILKDMTPEVIPFDLDIALIAGELAAATQPFGLSLGDRACLATAAHLGLEAVTADKVWGQIKGIAKIKVIR